MAIQLALDIALKGPCVTGSASNVVGLVRLAIDLGACTVGGPLSDREAATVHAAMDCCPSEISLRTATRHAILSGEDPLGDMLCAARPPDERRRAGAFYTPPSIVKPMVSWAMGQSPVRVVDAGCGSGRFSAAVSRERPDVQIIAVDDDPVATILTRACLSALGARNATVIQSDFLTLDLPRI